MKGLACFLLIFHLIIAGLWIANSQYLFSFWSVIIWGISIILGFLTYKKINEGIIIRKLILFGSSFMFFLLILTGLIHIATDSMP
ncbi:hypothetical protein CYL18_06815 [Pradoshia eiseniae]|uniref:DUF2768 domain-containing protein n=1 Tax=Pradoshia eiseniae TaxID=2064768 RepID=A0A2S7N0I6_9BACI|nr:hypothetical protein CYL18_06815 [Pradoshia eiseniae]